MSRTELRNITKKLGCPPKFLTMVIKLHDDHFDQVRHDSEFLQPFSIVNGVKQGCVLARHHVLRVTDTTELRNEYISVFAQMITGST